MNANRPPRELLTWSDGRAIRDIHGNPPVQGTHHRPAGGSDQATAATSSPMTRALYAPPGPNEPSPIPPPVPDDCPHCHGARYYKEAVPVWHPNFGKLFPCACKLAHDSEAQQERHASVLERLTDEMGPKLVTCRIENYGFPPGLTADERKSIRRARDAAAEYIANPQGWLFLCGPTGVGKSHLLAAITLALADAGWRVAFASAPDLIEFLKKGMQDGSTSERLEALKTVDFLALDDLGTEYHPGKQGGQLDYADAVLFQLLHARSVHGRATAITSNAPRKSLEPRIASRITGECREIVIDAPDERERQFKARQEKEQAGKRAS